MKKMLIIILFMNSLFGVSVDSVRYDANTNEVVLFFDTPIFTDYILLGLFSFSDGENIIQLTGGSINNVEIYSDSINISLIYGDILDSRLEYDYWGNTNVLASYIESLNLDELSLTIQNNAVIDTNFNESTTQIISVDVINKEDNVPNIVSVEYDENNNSLEIHFDRVVQFDQIPEDRSDNEGPGNQELDGNPSEDVNNNGVLDMEANINVLKIGFSGNSEFMMLEGYNTILQTYDSDTITISLTRPDAKKIEQNIISVEDLILNVTNGAFVDVYYNENISTQGELIVEVISDTIPLIVDQAIYELDDNELQIYFSESRDVSYNDPAPIYSKIKIRNDGQDAEVISLSGIKDISSSGTTLKLKELLFSDQAALELMISNTYENNDSVFYLNVEAYSIYDENGNGNMEVINLPLEITGEFENPELISIEYDAVTSTLTLDWGSNKVWYYQDNLLAITPNSFDVSEISIINTINEDTVSLSSLNISRSSNKKKTYLEINNSADAGYIQSLSGVNLILNIKPYTFYSGTLSSRDVNGNFTISSTFNYIGDTNGPVISSCNINEESNLLSFQINENIDLMNSDFSTFDLIINSDTLNIVTEWELPESGYSQEIDIAISESSMAELKSIIPNNELIEVTIIIQDSTVINLEGIWNEAQILDVSLGKTFWNKSFRAFAETPEQIFCSKKIIAIAGSEESYCSNPNFLTEESCIDAGHEWIHFEENFDELTIYVEETAWDSLFTATDLDSLVSFHGLHHNIIESFTGEYIDIDSSGGVTIVLYDISDEFDKGANDTNASLFVHGYSYLHQAAGYENEGDILFLDIGTQSIQSEDNFKSSLINAYVHEYSKMALEANEPDEEVWLREGLSFMIQDTILNDVMFFGNNTNPSGTPVNQLTYISYSLKDRTDLWNTYLFLTYLKEKTSGNYLIDKGHCSDQSFLNEESCLYAGWDWIVEEVTVAVDGWDIIQSISLNFNNIGMASIDTVLNEYGIDNFSTETLFLNYATACFLDAVQQDTVYNYIYSFSSDKFDLYGALSSKNAGVKDWNDASPPPYSFGGLSPWSYDYYLFQGYDVNAVDNSIIPKTPNLSPHDTLVFDGIDGVSFHANKIMLRNRFTENIDTQFEVVEIEIDDFNAFGKIPITTNSIELYDSTTFQFKYFEGSCSDDSFTDQTNCETNGFSWTWKGVPNMVIVVAKTDDSQPAITYDFVMSNIVKDQDYSNFYVLQNPGVKNYLDLYVISQRNIYDEYGVEGPLIQIISEFDSSAVLLESSDLYSADYILYQGPWELGNWVNYSLIYSGTDQNGIPVQPDTIEVSTDLITNYLGRNFNSPSNIASIHVPTDFEDNFNIISFESSYEIFCEMFGDNVTSLFPQTDVIYIGPNEYDLIQPFEINIKLTEEIADNNPQIYHFLENNWINRGGNINDINISTLIDKLGYFVIFTGNHTPVKNVESIPESFNLYNNYPNPFNSSTEITYSLPEQDFIQLNIYNLRGRIVNQLINEKQSSGNYRIFWDGTDFNNFVLPSGIYFTQLTTTKNSETIKMVLLK